MVWTPSLTIMKLKKVLLKWKREAEDDSIFQKKCTFITFFKHASIAQCFGLVFISIGLIELRTLV